MLCPSAAQCAMQPSIVICWLVNASTLSVREGTSDAHPTAVQPAGRPETFVEFDGALPLPVELGCVAEATELGVEEAEEEGPGLATARSLCLYRLNAQLPPQVPVASPAQAMLQDAAGRGSPAWFWNELPPV